NLQSLETVRHGKPESRDGLAWHEPWVHAFYVLAGPVVRIADGSRPEPCGRVGGVSLRNPGDGDRLPREHDQRGSRGSRWVLGRGMPPSRSNAHLHARNARLPVAASKK